MTPRDSRFATRLLRVPAVVPRDTLRARLYRSFSWPVALRLRSETEVTVAGGGKMLVRTDDLLGRVLAISGVYEPNVTAAFRAALEPGDVCLDIGAHVGYYTVLGASLVGSEGHVYAFEPSPENYKRLVTNVELNGLGNVTAIELAVGPEQGTAVLYEVPGQNTGLATLSPELAAKSTAAPREVTVDVGPVTSVIAADEVARIRVIKIDVEWHELEVLRSLTPVFESADRLSVLVEWSPHRSAPDAAEEFHELCQRHGFTMYGLGSGHSLERMFPDRIDEPERLDDVPKEQTDLLLLR